MVSSIVATCFHDVSLCAQFSWKLGGGGPERLGGSVSGIAGDKGLVEAIRAPNYTDAVRKLTHMRDRFGKRGSIICSKDRPLQE